MTKPIVARSCRSLGSSPSRQPGSLGVKADSDFLFGLKVLRSIETRKLAHFYEHLRSESEA